MSKIKTLFWDVGGVIMTNGWDSTSRKKASEHFDFDLHDFETRHVEILEAFETGRMSLDEYITETLFFQPRLFKKQAFKEFMFSMSEPCPETMEVLRRLADSRKYQMATINNESLDLNLYRIEKFHLKDYFTCFFSSSFLRLRKPGREIYEQALYIIQRKPEECLFIDDRKENLGQAEILGMSTIHYQDAEQLSRELQWKLEA